MRSLVVAAAVGSVILPALVALQAPSPMLNTLGFLRYYADGAFPARDGITPS
jgi:hypothetical protein